MKPGTAYSKMLAEQGPLLRRTAGISHLCPASGRDLYGPGDKYHLLNVIKNAKSGVSIIRLGNGKAKFSHIFSGNAAHAHILAARTSSGRIHR